MLIRNRVCFAPDGGGTGTGAGGTGTGGAAPAFSWAPDLDAPIVDLLKAKGMYDDPIKGANSLARSYFEANKALSGGDVLVLPKADDPDYGKKIDGFFGKVRGVAKPEEYEISFGDDVKVHPPLIDFAKKLAFTWGVPKSEVMKGMKMWQEFAQGEAANFKTAADKANSDAIAELKTKQGEAVFNANMAAGQNVVKALKAKGAISQATLEAVESNIGSIAMVELLVGIGNGMKEGGALGISTTQTAPTDPSQMTAEQASDEIARLQGDADFQKKYQDGKHPEHAVAVKRMADLFTAKTRRPAT